ncbi:DUF6223 family protein [Streptomyces sp. NPDC001478]
MSVHPVPAAPAIVRASARPLAADAYDLTTGRLVGTAGALVALAGVVLGALVLTRFTAPARRGARRRGAFAALAAGLAGTAVGVVNLSVADGGPGTGNGVVGGAAALVLGPLAAALAALALRRSHRAGAPSAHPSR